MAGNGWANLLSEKSSKIKQQEQGQRQFKFGPFKAS